LASQNDLTSALNAKAPVSTTMTTSHAANGVTTQKIINWDLAYGWGNHASAGYALNSALSSYALNSALAGYVPTSRTVNGHSLSGNVSVSTTDLSLNNVDNTSDATKNAASVTLTNKTLTSPKINEDVAMTTTSTYLNRVDATSSIQGQLNAKAVAINFYVSNTGSDVADGLTPATAWQTISKVNASTFNPGSSILFNKGDTWREELIIPSSGISSSYITFGSYGTGNAPQILGSSLVTAWTSDGSNVWHSTTTVSNPYALTYNGNVYFKETSGLITWGKVKVANRAALVSEYQWEWESNHIYIYSPTDPNTRYSGVEVTQRAIGISLNSKSYITIDGLEVAYANAGGIDEGIFPFVNLTGLIVKNCNIHHTGIKSSAAGYGLGLAHSNMLIQNNIIHDSGRRNISLNLYAANIQVSSIIVENNTLYRGFHTTGVDIETDGAGTLDNLIIRNNLIYDDITETLDGVESHGADGIFIGGGTGLTNIYIYNNLVKNTTKFALEINYSQSVYVYNNTFYGVNPNVPEFGLGLVGLLNSANCTFKNNILYNNASSVGGTRHYACLVLSGAGNTMTSDYNLFYNTDATQRMFYWKIWQNDYTVSQWATYKSTSSQDAHSPTPADPLFTASSVYTLQSHSPAAGVGVVINDYTTDYNGVAISSTPNLGAFQTTTSTIPVYVSSAVADATPTILVMTYNLTLENITPDPTAFTVLVNSGAIAVNSVAISGINVQLTLASPVTAGNTVTVAYTQPAINPIQTILGAQAVNLTAQSVTNNISFTTSYANAGGQGDRTSTVTVTRNGFTSYGLITTWVNGAKLDNVYSFNVVNPITGIWVLFDFGSGARRIINEATFFEGAAQGQGTWQWQGSNDASVSPTNFTNIGSTFTLTNGVLSGLSGNTTGYRHYRMLGVSGALSGACWIYEMEFKIY
jgi:hypothetical protein